MAPLLSSDQFTLVRGAQVTRLNWNKAEQRVESVDYIDRTSRRLTTMRGRAGVLAAGAVDTTTILLRSVSAEFPDGVGNSRGLVGRYLHDHPREWWPASPAKPMRALAHPMYLSRQPYDPDMIRSRHRAVRASAGAAANNLHPGCTAGRLVRLHT